jgi:ubiquinol-cytochrome c reductase iron-sulfur subunit
MDIPPPTAAPPAPDPEKRALLIAAAVVGGAGIVTAAVPFVASLEPSAAVLAAAAPVDVDVSKLNPGEMRTVAWRGQPVWIMRRTPAEVAALLQPNPGLADPLSARSQQPANCANATRSIRPDLFVCVGICTHLGCSPALRLADAALDAQLRAPDGYVCACHGSVFDLAGRVVRNVPAPVNLVIPAHRFTGPDSLEIG